MSEIRDYLHGFNAETREELRPREKMQKYGARSLSDDELMCALIGSGTKERPVETLAKDLYSAIYSSGVQEGVGVSDLMKISGLGLAKACAITAALEIGRRKYANLSHPVNCVDDIYQIIRHFAFSDKENFILVTLNGAEEVISTKVISIGSVNRSIVHPRDVFYEAVQDHAVSIFVAHNHPSGNLTPSSADLEVTRILRSAAEIFRICLIDHLIFNTREYYSIREHTSTWV